MREAVQRLVYVGLAEMTPHKGALIVKFSRDDIVKLMRVREALEVLLVHELCETITDSRIDFCRERLLALLERSSEEREGEFSQEEFDFHDYLTENIKNPFLLSLINIISNKIKILRFQSGVFSGREEPAISEHLRILDAIKERNPDLAEALIKVHIANATENILAAMSTD